MSDTPWQSEGRWFTSPWNFLEPACEGLAFPRRVRFHDVTPREQPADIAFTHEDKVAIAKRPRASRGRRAAARAGSACSCST